MNVQQKSREHQLPALLLWLIPLLPTPYLPTPYLPTPFFPYCPIPLLPYSLISPLPISPLPPIALLPYSPIPLLPYSLIPLFPFHSVGAYYARVGVVAEAVAGFHFGFDGLCGCCFLPSCKSSPEAFG
jgi:hypothetical protein